MIRLAGLSIQNQDNPEGDIAITLIGRRPAEKTHEELFYDPQSAKPTRLAKILRAPQEQILHRPFDREIAKLRKAFDNEDEADARRILFDFIAEKDRHTDDTNRVVSLELIKNLDVKLL
jgi:FlaA1/EpsC-like NDP-sugar epimerase